MRFRFGRSCVTNAGSRMGGGATGSAMSSHRTPSILSEALFLTRSGLRYAIRPVCRSDEAGLRDMFLRCSADDLRLRCFGMSKTFPVTFASRLARLTDPAEFALVAVTGQGEIVGVVHAVGLSEAEGDADYDIMVRSDLKGQGIGTRMMRSMLAEAARAGFSAVGGDVMMSNRAMLLLADDLGFRRVGMDAGVVRISTRGLERLEA
jgi:ribosomal protein S18 acetylase RimI-like enzyme